MTNNFTPAKAGQQRNRLSSPLKRTMKVMKKTKKSETTAPVQLPAPSAGRRPGAVKKNGENALWVKKY